MKKEKKKNSIHSRHLSLINNVFLVRHFCFVFSRKILVPFPAGQICCNLRQWIEAFRETFQFRSKESFKKIGAFNILCRRKEKDGLFFYLFFTSKIIWEQKQIRTHLGRGRELNLIQKKKVEVQGKKENSERRKFLKMARETDRAKKTRRGIFSVTDCLVFLSLSERNRKC